MSTRVWSFAWTLKALVDGETRRVNSERELGIGLVEDSLLGMHCKKRRKNKIQEKRSYTNSRLVFWDIPEATIIGQGCYN